MKGNKMKSWLYAAALVLLLGATEPAVAQVRWGVGIQFGAPPPWRREIVVVRPHRYYDWDDGYWVRERPYYTRPYWGPDRWAPRPHRWEMREYRHGDRDDRHWDRDDRHWDRDDRHWD